MLLKIIADGGSLDGSRTLIKTISARYLSSSVFTVVWSVCRWLIAATAVIFLDQCHSDIFLFIYSIITA